MYPGYPAHICGAPYTQDNQSITFAKPVSETLAVMHTHWPEWQHAMNIAKKCMVSLSLNGNHRGMGVFFTNFQNLLPGETTKTLLIPKHLIAQEVSVNGNNLQELISAIRIHLLNDPVAYRVRLSENGDGLDYCLLTVEVKGNEAPVRIGYDNMVCGYSYMYAEMGAGSNDIFITFVSPYLDPHTSQTMLRCLDATKTEWTQPGSCGGIYLDQSGQLIGIHLGRSDDHRKGRIFLSAQDVAQISTKITTLDQNFNPVKESSMISPSPIVDYVQEKDARIPKTEPDANGYYCVPSERHLSNSQRALQIDLKQIVPNQKTKKHEHKDVCSLYYQVYLVNSNGTERPNIHNNKGSPSSYTNETAPNFYKIMVQKFQNNIPKLGIQPDSFDFDFDGFDFIGRKIGRPK